MKIFKIYLLLCIICMGVIFYFSHQPVDVSRAQSEAVVDIVKSIPLIKEVAQSINHKNLLYIVRKCAHFLLYLTLAMLSIFLINSKTNSIIKSSIYSIIICFIYACSDEIHQIFVMGRGAQMKDVMIDSLGAIMGIFIAVVLISCKNFILWIARRNKNKIYKWR